MQLYLSGQEAVLLKDHVERVRARMHANRPTGDHADRPNWNERVRLFDNLFTRLCGEPDYLYHQRQAETAAKAR